LPPEYDKSQCFTLIFSRLKGAQLPQFFSYFLNSEAGMTHFRLEGWGSAQINISVPTVQEIRVPWPSFDEQVDIVGFLDQETRKIDRLIDVRRKQIDCLQERRRTIIHTAVTKGLDPTSPMKESGVAWLGNIPFHWKVKRLKYLVRLNQETLSEKTPGDYLIDYIDIGNVDSYGRIREIQSFEFVNAPSRARRKVTIGSTVISTVRTYLRAIAHFESPSEITIVSTGFAVLDAQSALRSKFLYYCVASEYFVQRVVSESKGVGYPAINSTDIVQIKIAYPDDDEQRSIVEYIEAEAANIDILISKYTSELELLTEYRSSLISQAVTGAIDVRNLVKPAKHETTGAK